MKKMYLCALFLAAVAVQSFAQTDIHAKDILTFKTYDKGQLLSEKSYKQADASQVDLAAMVNSMEGRYTVYGRFMKDGMLHSVFHSGNANEGQLCAKETLGFKSMFGISGYSNDNFTGLVIKEVAENSPAEDLGLIAGDIVYTIGDQEITSYCDLFMAVQAAEVGEVVNVEYSKDGRIINGAATIAGKPYMTINFEACETSLELDAPVTEAEKGTADLQVDLAVFPNPTRGISYVTYTSESKEPLSFLVMDSNGALVHTEEVAFFQGVFRTTYNFNNLPAGSYYFTINQGEQSAKSKVLYIGS